MLEIVLPWPPSVNHYWKLGRGRIFLGTEGRRYKLAVVGAVRCLGVQPFVGDVSLEIEAYPPDRRKRDLDNIQKSIWDALGKAGLYDDDSQVKHVEAWMREPIPGGKIVVCISDYDSGRYAPPAIAPDPSGPNDCSSSLTGFSPLFDGEDNHENRPSCQAEPAASASRQSLSSRRRAGVGQRTAG